MSDIDEAALWNRAHAILRMSHLEHTAPVCTCDNVLAELRAYDVQVNTALDQRDAANRERELLQAETERLRDCLAHEQYSHGSSAAAIETLEHERDAAAEALERVAVRLREAERLALIHAHRTGWTSAFELYDAIHALVEATP